MSDSEFEPEKLNVLIVKRRSVKGQITKFQNYLKTISGSDCTDPKLHNELSSKLAKFERMLDRFDELQSRIEVINQDELESELNEREEIEESIHKAIAAAKVKLGLVPSSRQSEYNVHQGTSTPEHSRCAHACQDEQVSFRLPSIKIPNFDGSYHKWLEFYDTFMSLIHSNNKIKSIHKFHYLISYLEGEAAGVIANLEVSASNYDEAWGLLCERFNNTRQLISNHVDSLLGVDSMSRESYKSLRFLVDHVSKHLRALKNLGEDTRAWDTLIIHIMSRKLDPHTSLRWEEHRNDLPSSRMPILDEFLSFLKGRADVLETLQRSKQVKSSQVFNQVKSSSSNNASFQVASSSISNKNYKPNKSFVITASQDQTNGCFVCQASHKVYDCPILKSRTPEERTKLVISKRLCLNCLRSGHDAHTCRLSSCRICKKRHNTLLHCQNTHKSSTNTVTAVPNTSASNEPGLNSSVTMSVISTSQVVLSTALVDVINPVSKQTHTVKALLDCGSMSSFITEGTKHALGLFSRPLDTTTIVGIGNASLNKIPELCTLTMKSRCTPFSVTLSCLVLPEITDALPKYPLNIDQFNIPQGIKLADPSFHTPGEIGMLIGADLFWDVIGCKQQSLGAKLPILRSSKLGWFLAGPISGKSSIISNARVHCNFSALNSLHDRLSKFWELEELPVKYELQDRMDSENQCEKHFVANLLRLQDGMFSVRLPLIDSADCLGDSYHTARKRFLNLEKRFERQPKLKQLYTDFMQEYIDLGHMSEAKVPKPDTCYFVPHHPVLKDKSESTKLRAVFDASCSTTSGFSINDLQMVGPNIQDSLFNILVRFRYHTFVLTGDIEKMYRQVLINELDRDLQLILWRNDPSSSLKTYRLNTVTYGFASASFLSTRCIWQLGEECHDSNIKQIIQNDFYVDDLITGCDTEEELIQVQGSITNALALGNFSLRKFRSNSQAVVESTALNIQGNLAISQSCDTLGLNWNPATDKLQFPVASEIASCAYTPTKRSVLSKTFQIFDPLGLLSLCTIKPKLLMQKLWTCKAGWDSPIPRDIERAWKRFIENLSHISQIKIPRNVILHSPVSVELHCFGDASQAAYGACVYLKSVDHAGNVSVQLYCAKSRVAPSKPTLTIPRLELLAALLAARLASAVRDALRRPVSACHFWTDSSVVLAWLATDPSRLKVWVANRVRYVNELTGSSSWRHVPSEQNPADLASRGVDPHQVQGSTLWWGGPLFLLQPEFQWPQLSTEKVAGLPEIRVLTATVIEPIQFCIDVEKFSKFKYLQRVVAYTCRFIQNCKSGTSRQVGPLTVSELDNAFMHLARIAQRDSFPDVLKILQEGKQLRPKSNVAALSPFLDKHGIIRVGGRLEASDYTYDKKHPVLLSAKHHITKLLFVQEHLRQLHAGPQLLLASIRESVWPVGGRDLARRTARSCIKCRRVGARALENIMGNLPPQRLMPGFPFSTVAVDFAGPFMIADRRGRGCKITKAYLCLFICFRTKCVHLEAVSELSRDAFILTLRRFISRRGKPTEIFSDNGRNFVAAAKVVGTFIQENSESISKFACDQGMKFVFSPAYAPNFNGLVEAGIKAAKFHLKRILGNSHFTFEELSTLFSQVEAILNSRPLCTLSSSPDDLTPLTPGHFLIGRSLTSLPSPCLEVHNTTRLDRYQRLEQARQHFWKRWQLEYITGLQQKLKWRVRSRDLHPGDVVILKDDNAPPLHWRLGRVERLFPGTDGVPRVADIVTARGTTRRALSKICLLQEDQQDDLRATTACLKARPTN